MGDKPLQLPLVTCVYTVGPVGRAEDLRDRVLHRLGGQQCLQDPGRIVVQFVVDEVGSVVDDRTLDGIDDALCDGLAMSVIYDTAFHRARDAEGSIQMVMNWPLTITLPAAR